MWSLKLASHMIVWSLTKHTNPWINYPDLVVEVQFPPVETQTPSRRDPHIPFSHRNHESCHFFRLLLRSDFHLDGYCRNPFSRCWRDQLRLRRQSVGDPTTERKYTTHGGIDEHGK